MANIRVDLSTPIYDGMPITFKAPADCSEITGLRVYYPDSETTTTSQDFTLSDANRNDIGNINNLFTANALVKVILDTDDNMAFVQNANTNAYLEGKFGERNLKTYTSLEQIGLVQGNENIDEIALELPNNSCLEYAITVANTNEIYPGDTTGGICRVFKYNDSRVTFEYCELVNNKKWFGVYYARNFSGWAEIPNTNQFAIRTYGDIASLGLANGDLSSTDFVAAMTTIISAMQNKSVLTDAITSSKLANLYKCVLDKLNADLGTNYAAQFEINIFKWYTNNWLTEIQVMVDAAGARNKKYMCIFDTSSGKVTISKFAEVYNEDGFFSNTQKPQGTYTGNGSSSTREIAVGGKGSVIIITSGNGLAIVTERGAIIKSSSSTTVTGLGVSAVNFSDGLLEIASTSNYVNENNVTYSYQVV